MGLDVFVGMSVVEDDAEIRKEKKEEKAKKKREKDKKGHTSFSGEKGVACWHGHTATSALSGWV